MEKKEKQSVDKFLEGKQASNLFNFIIAKTFARHSQMTEDEFLKDIGFENSGKNEREAIRMSLMNVMIATMNEFISAKNTIKMINGLMKIHLLDEKITVDSEKGE